MKRDSDPFSGMDSNKKREILNKKFVNQGGQLNFNPALPIQTVTNGDQEVKENTTPLEVIMQSGGDSLLSKWEKELEGK